MCIDHRQSLNTKRLKYRGKTNDAISRNVGEEIFISEQILSSRYGRPYDIKNNCRRVIL